MFAAICRYRRRVRVTKEIEAEELEQLTKPEARATAAFDARELQGLLDQSRRDDDDLAVPAELPTASSPIPTIATPELATTAPASVQPLARRWSLLPWVIAALACAAVVVLALWR